MVPKIFKDMTDYLKYDNNYWTEERRRKNLCSRVAALILVPTIFISGFSISKKQYLWDLSYSLGEKTQAGIAELTKDFPLRLLAYKDVFLSTQMDFSEKEIISYLDNKHTEANIKKLIRKDNDITYAEIGGIVSIEEDNGLKYFKFTEIESENMLFAKKIIRNKENPEKLRKLMVSDEGRKIFKKLRINPQLTDHSNEKLVNLYVSSYMQQSDWSCLIEKGKWTNSLYLEGNIQGKFVGDFHIHDQEPPNDIDLKENKKIREFIISNQGNKYILYELIDGKINNKISREFRY